MSQRLQTAYFAGEYLASECLPILPVPADGTSPFMSKWGSSPGFHIQVGAGIPVKDSLGCKIDNEIFGFVHFGEDIILGTPAPPPGETDVVSWLSSAGSKDILVNPSGGVFPIQGTPFRK